MLYDKDVPSTVPVPSPFSQALPLERPPSVPLLSCQYRPAGCCSVLDCCPQPSPKVGWCTVESA